MENRDKTEIISDLSQAINDYYEINDSLIHEEGISAFVDNQHRIDDIRDELDQKTTAALYHAEELINAVLEMK